MKLVVIAASRLSGMSDYNSLQKEPIYDRVDNTCYYSSLNSLDEECHIVVKTALAFAVIKISYPKELATWTKKNSSGYNHIIILSHYLAQVGLSETSSPDIYYYQPLEFM